MRDDLSSRRRIFRISKFQRVAYPLRRLQVAVSQFSRKKRYSSRNDCAFRHSREMRRNISESLQNVFMPSHLHAATKCLKSLLREGEEEEEKVVFTTGFRQHTRNFSPILTADDGDDPHLLFFSFISNHHRDCLWATPKLLSLSSLLLQKNTKRGVTAAAECVKRRFCRRSASLFSSFKEP